MKHFIHSDNYESYYLDYLEGNLSENELVAFEAFLVANPHLQIKDDLVYAEPVKLPYSNLEKSLLLQPDGDISIENNIEYHIIELIENQLSSHKLDEMKTVLAHNKQAQTLAKEYMGTKLQPELIIYSNKESLKRKEIALLPTWKWITVITGTAAAILILAIQVAERHTKTVSEISANRTNPKTISDSSQRIESTPLQASEENQTQVFNEQKTDYHAARPVSNTQSATQNSGNYPTLLPEMDKVSPSVSATLNAESTEKQNKDVAFADILKKQKDEQQANNVEAEHVNQVPKMSNAATVQPQEKKGFYIKIGSFELSFKKGGKK